MSKNNEKIVNERITLHSVIEEAKRIYPGYEIITTIDLYSKLQVVINQHCRDEKNKLAAEQRFGLAYLYKQVLETLSGRCN